MKLKIIIFSIILIAIIAITYLAFFRKSASSVVLAPAEITTPVNTGAGTSVTVKPVVKPSTNSTGIVPPPSQVGKSAFAKRVCNAYDMHNSVRKTVQVGEWVGTVTGVVGNMTYLLFSDSTKGWVTTTDVTLK